MCRLLATDEDLSIVIQEDGNGITAFCQGQEDASITEMLNLVLQRAEPMGGTFYPRPNTMLGYYHALRTLGMHVIVEGDLGTMPHQPGRVY